MSPSSSPVRRRRPRRPPRPSRGRNRPPRRVAIATVVRSVLVVAAVSSITIGTYFAFTDDVLTRLIGRQQNTYDDQIAKLRAQIDLIVSSQVLDQKQVEQQLTELLQRQKMLQQAFTGDLSATGTIKPERTAPPEAMPAAPPEAMPAAPPEAMPAAPPEAMPAEKPTPASPINDTAILFAPARLQSPELPARAKTKHHRIHHAALHRASLRHRVAPPRTMPAEQSPQLTRTPGIVDQ